MLLNYDQPVSNSQVIPTRTVREEKKQFEQTVERQTRTTNRRTTEVQARRHNRGRLKLSAREPKEEKKERTRQQGASTPYKRWNKCRGDFYRNLS